MIRPEHITLGWHVHGETPDAAEARRRFAGYEASDFFSDGGAWAKRSYPDAMAALAAAATAYKGSDSDGTGVAVMVQDGSLRHRCPLFGDINF